MEWGRKLDVNNLRSIREKRKESRNSSNQIQWQIKKVQTPTPRILAIIGLLITTKLSDFLHAIVSEGGGGEVNNSWTLSLMERISHLTLWLTCRDDHYLEASLKTHSENYRVNEKNNYFNLLTGKNYKISEFLIFTK